MLHAETTWLISDLMLELAKAVDCIAHPGPQCLARVEGQEIFHQNQSGRPVGPKHKEPSPEVEQKVCSIEA